MCESSLFFAFLDCFFAIPVPQSVTWTLLSASWPSHGELSAVITSRWHHAVDLSFNPLHYGALQIEPSVFVVVRGGGGGHPHLATVCVKELNRPVWSDNFLFTNHLVVFSAGLAFFLLSKAYLLPCKEVDEKIDSTLRLAQRLEAIMKVALSS